MRAHHCKNSAKCREGALETRSKDAKVSESVHIGVLLCFCPCRVFLVSITTTGISVCDCARKRVCACYRPACVWTLQCFHVVPRPQNRGIGMVLAWWHLSKLFFCVCMFRSTVLNQSRTLKYSLYKVDVQQRHEQLALLNTHIFT